METIRHILFVANSTFSFRDILLISLISTITGWFIWFAYNVTHKNSPNNFFTISIFCICPLISVFEYGFNIVDSLYSLIIIIVLVVILLFVFSKYGPKQDMNDLFIFWAICCGLLCGIKQFISSSIICIVIFGVFLGVRKVIDETVRLLIIKGDSDRSMDVKALIFKYFDKKAKLVSSIEFEEDNTFELIYRVPNKKLEEFREERFNLAAAIEHISGISNVTIIKEDQKDEQ